MTRKEEIRQEAHRKYPYVGGTKGMICENSIPIFIQGAEWADKTMIDKACEWIQKEVLEDYPYIIWPDIVKDFRKAMEE